MTSYFLFGPALFRIYRNLEMSEKYVGNSFERYGSNIIFCLNLAWNLGIYFVPPYLSYQVISRRGEFFQASTLNFVVRYMTGIGLVYLVALSMRAVGRASNPVYRDFIRDLRKAVKHPTEENKSKLSVYDAEFKPWPVDFSMKDGKPSGRSFDLSSPSRSLIYLPYRFIAWLMTNTFGLKLVYPGSIKLLQAGIAEPLEEGRAKWVIEKKGKRYKLQTIDNNEIDSMFFDRRKTQNENGETLVISCEGNAGFYEIGFIGSPMDAGYSVLGWNHPGFAGSSGNPFPAEETNAMDAVVQFAIQRLAFKPEQIVLHGWSIGGFPVAWAAKNYPDVKAVVLDATFDHLLPLAMSRMPESLEKLVTIAVEDYMNLNVMDQLVKYNGPIRLIRRTHDEIITTVSGDRRTNRGNFLLIGLLRHRYPNLIGPDEEAVVHEYLSFDEAGQGSNVGSPMMLTIAKCPDLLQTSADETTGTSLYPAAIGRDLCQEEKMKLSLFLVSRYMVDYDSTHCTPLPANRFELPWEPPQPNHNNDFVKI